MNRRRFAVRPGSTLSGGSLKSAVSRLMETMDQINAKLGRHSLTFAGALNRAGWKMKQGNLSARYTKDWAELPIVRA